MFFSLNVFARKKTVPTFSRLLHEKSCCTVGVVHSSCHGTVSRELAKDQIEYNCEEKKL